MLADEQTHKLPEADAERRARGGALRATTTLRSFDAAITRTLKGVNARYGELFPEEEPLSSRFGSLVFTGVEDDPETLATLKRMGFSNPPRSPRPSAPGTTATSPATAHRARAASCSRAWRRACWTPPRPPARPTPPSTASATSSRGLSSRRAAAVAVPGPAATSSS